MSQFAPRSGNANYIKRRGKSYYYRRVIPVKFRSFFEGKTEWNIKLEAATDAGRKAEAGTLAHKHNKMMTIENFDDIVTSEHNPVDDTLSVKLDFSPENLPVNKQVPPFEFYRNGKLVKAYKIAGSNDPDFLKQAEAEGYFAMTGPEFWQQTKFSKLRQSFKSAEERDDKELARFRLRKAQLKLDKLAPPKGDTLRTILPKMHQQYQPRQSTKDGHKRAIEEFIALHGDLPVASITKRHVSEYLEFLGTIRFRNQPLAPTTVKQRLDKLVAILQFATTVDAVDYNVGKSIKAPKDTRPQGDQTYKPFSKPEVRKLIDLATNAWTKRRYQSHRTQMSRMTDSITALHMLVWTGARPEEVCQLRLDDVDLDRMGIMITNETDELEASDRKLKNEESVRGVPIHNTLLPRLSEHMEQVLQVSNSGLLFPSFEPMSEKGRYATPIGADWSKHFRAQITADPQKVLYSLRHSWAGESVRVGMSETMRNAIMGHKSDSKSSSAKRYRFHFEDLDNQLEWVNKMDCIGG
jgi:integrase